MTNDPSLAATANPATAPSSATTTHPRRPPQPTLVTYIYDVSSIQDRLHDFAPASQTNHLTEEQLDSYMAATTDQRILALARQDQAERGKGVGEVN